MQQFGDTQLHKLQLQKPKLLIKHSQIYTFQTLHGSHYEIYGHCTCIQGIICFWKLQLSKSGHIYVSIISLLRIFF